MSESPHRQDSRWGRTTPDYAQYRHGYPSSFFNRLSILGVGVPSQRVLDLATGTGNVARQLAKRGCTVTAIDISPEQIEAARNLANIERVEVEFLVCPAEDTKLPASSFDLITAAQSFMYFDLSAAIGEVRRLLAPKGMLMTSQMCWLPRVDALARRTEELVLKFNPRWASADFQGEISPLPKWSTSDFEVVGFFNYEEAIPFTRESWRGRVRACRGVGVELDSRQVEQFDAAHAMLLQSIAPSEFTVLHGIAAHIFRVR